MWLINYTSPPVKTEPESGSEEKSRATFARVLYHRHEPLSTKLRISGLDEVKGGDI
jgi:hypothetical protein